MDVLEHLYMRSPVPVQNALVSAYGLVLYWRRLASRKHRRLLAELERIEAFSSEQLAEYEAQRLRETLVHAGRTVPHYRSHFSRLGVDPRQQDPRTILEKLPVLDKTEVRQAPRRFHSEEVDGTYVINTSGTTGSPLEVACSRDALLRNYAHFYRLRQRLGVHNRDRCATFAGRKIVEPDRAEPPFWRHNWIANTILYSTYHLTPQTLDAYMERLAQQAPVLIDSYPSALGILANALLAREDLEVHPRAIITSSETLLPHQRSTAEAAFGCSVTDQYGNAEMTAFVAQCEQGTYHVWPSYGICEILVDGRPARSGESGELVTTGFINDAMPLVRYRTGDTAVKGIACDCGLAFPSIERIEGRMDDQLVTPDGRMVGRLDPVFKGLPTDAFHEVQIVQTERDNVVLRYVPGTRFSEAVVEKVRAELQARLGSACHVEVEQVGTLPRGPNGKLQAVVGMDPGNPG